MPRRKRSVWDYIDVILVAVFTFLFVVSLNSIILMVVFGWLERLGVTDPLQAYVLILIGSLIALILLGENVIKRLKK